MSDERDEMRADLTAMRQDHKRLLAVAERWERLYKQKREEAERLEDEVRHYRECDGDHYDLIRENERLRAASGTGPPTEAPADERKSFLREALGASYMEKVRDPYEALELYRARQALAGPTTGDDDGD